MKLTHIEQLWPSPTQLEETTTIRLRKSTVRKLRAIGSRGQSDDFIVNAILFTLMEKAEGVTSQRLPASDPEASKAAEEGSPSPSVAKS